jgi:hypothetical protein
MPQSANLEPVAQAPGVFARRRHAHTFPAIDVALQAFPESDEQKKEVQSFLDTTLHTALCVAQGGPPQIKVLVDNVAAGHSFPSGAAQDRRVWVEVIGYAGAIVVYQSGVVADGTAVTSLKDKDADLWLLRDCIFDSSGAEVHNIWQAATTEGNALPAPVTADAGDPRFYQTHVEQTFPRGATLAQAVDRVTMRVRVQPMAIDVLQDLVTSGDLDTRVAGAMLTYDIGQPLEWTAAAATAGFVEDRVQYKCVTKTAFDVTADKFPATAKTRCAP